MQLIESSLFAALAEYAFSQDEYQELQQYLLEHPSAGIVILRSGGLRKLRWRARGHGKRGSARTIYYARTHADQLCLLSCYAKSEYSELSHRQLKRLRRLINCD